MDKEKQALDKFLLNIDCLDEFKPFIKQSNIFNILKTSSHEIRHSNILAWLLKPEESHGLGDLFITSFVREIIKNYNNKYDISKWAFLDYSKAIIERECYQQGKGKYLDIFILFEKDKKLIAIENKFKAKEGKDQTETYRKIIEDKYPKYEKMYIYLTLEGDEAQDKQWDSISYDTVKFILENIVKNNNLQDRIKLVLKDYIEIIGGDSMEKEKCAEICSKIYKEHKEALDLIFEYRDIERTNVAEFVKNVMKEVAQENKNIVYSEKFNSGVSYIRFATEYLNKELGFATENVNIWRNNQRFLYELKTGEVLNTKDVCMYITFTTDNLEDRKDELLLKYEKIKTSFNKNSNSKTNNRIVSMNRIPNFIKDAVLYITEKDSKEKLKKKIINYVNETEDKIREALK